MTNFYDVLDKMISKYGMYDSKVIQFAKKLEELEDLADEAATTVVKNKKEKCCGSIWFDMDGTVADLYGQENWLERLRSFDSGVYSDCSPLVDMKKLEAVCTALQCKGWKIGVISWGSMEDNEEFFAATEKAKKEWLKQYMPYVDEIHVQKYGVAKSKAPEKKTKIMILVDDNEKVRKDWDTPKQRKSIDAKNLDIIKELMKLL